MRSPLIAAAAVFLAQPAHSQTSRDTILALDSAWARAYAVNDTALALDLLSPDFIMTGPNGALKDRAREMGDIRPTPGLSLHFFRSVGADARCYSGACVVTGLLEWEYEMNGRTGQSRFRYTATWVPGGPRQWRMVALHLGPAPADR